MPEVHDYPYGLPRSAPIVKRGTWLYANQVPCAVIIVRHDVWYGSGDVQDTPEFAEDREVECYYVLFGTPTGNPEYVGGGGGLTVEAATAIAEKKLDSTLKWSE